MISGLFYIFAFFFTAGCASDVPVQKVELKKTINEKILKDSCMNRKDALSCAKLGYYFQGKGDYFLAHSFYKKGCQLSDESSCYNMKSSNPKAVYFKKLDGLMSFHSNNITNCHSKTREIKKFYSSMELKEKWHKVNIAIHINPEGRADSVRVNSNLSQKFKNLSLIHISEPTRPY